MNAADLSRTQLIQPGSRVTYAALFAGAPGRVTAFKRLAPDASASRRTAARHLDASPQIKNAVDRAGRFLTLASLVAVLSVPIAVAMSARRYVGRHLDSVALLKTLGATSEIHRMAHDRCSCLPCALAAAVIGSVVGYLAQAWLVYASAAFLPTTALPAASLMPVGMGFLMAMALLAGFALPPLLQLSRVPAIRVLRRDVGPPRPLMLLAFGPAVAVVVLLIYWVVLRLEAVPRLHRGLAAFVALLALTGALLVTVAGRLRAQRRDCVALRRCEPQPPARRQRRADRRFRYRHHGAVASRDHPRRLNGDWRRSLPADLPNYFFINIPPAEP